MRPVTDWPKDASEVKGAWFVSARGSLVDADGPDAIEDIASRMRHHAEALREPLPGTWYPEAALAEMLRAMDAYLGHDEAVFEARIVDATRRGVNTFFRLVLAMTSPAFLLGRVPTLWSLLRRNDTARIKVESEAGASTIHYRDFPWFVEPLYRTMTVGTLRGIVEINTGRRPEAAIVDAGSDHLSVRVVYPK